MVLKWKSRSKRWRTLDGPSQSRGIVLTMMKRSSGATWMYDLEPICSTGSIIPTILTDTSSDHSSSGCRSDTPRMMMKMMFTTTQFRCRFFTFTHYESKRETPCYFLYLHKTLIDFIIFLSLSRCCMHGLWNLTENYVGPNRPNRGVEVSVLVVGDEYPIAT